MALFNDGNSVLAGTTGCQHGVQYNDLPLLNIVRQLAVIFDRLQCFGVSIQADMANLGGRHHGQHAFHHAESRAQNGHESQLAAGNHFRCCRSDRCFRGCFFQRQVTGCLVALQHGNFTDQLTKILTAGVFIPQVGQFMLNQRVVHNKYIFRVLHKR